MIICRDKKHLGKIYERSFKRDFPDSELKPLFILEKYLDEEQGEYLELTDEDNTIGYAFSIIGRDYVIIDYLAVHPEYREKGYGKLFVGELKKRYSDIRNVLIETESPIDEVSRKRIEFYRSAGCIVSDVRISLWDVEYNIVSLNKHVPSINELTEIYQDVYGPEYEKHVVI